MMPEGVPLEYFLRSENAAKIGSNPLRRSAEDVFVQPPVIFPRVHVTRNIRRFDWQSPHLSAMGCEECAQAPFRIEVN